MYTKYATKHCLSCMLSTPLFTKLVSNQGSDDRAQTKQPAVSQRPLNSAKHLQLLLVSLSNRTTGFFVFLSTPSKFQFSLCSSFCSWWQFLRSHRWCTEWLHFCQQPYFISTTVSAIRCDCCCGQLHSIRRILGSAIRCHCRNCSCQHIVVLVAVEPQ